MKDYPMKQCRLVNGNVFTTAWIPSKFAVLNKNLVINNTPGWKVDTVSNVVLPISYVDERSRDYKYQREASDI